MQSPEETASGDGDLDTFAAVADAGGPRWREDRLEMPAPKHTRRHEGRDRKRRRIHARIIAQPLDAVADLVVWVRIEWIRGPTAGTDAVVRAAVSSVFAIAGAAGRFGAFRRVTDSSL
jgi:hypothetical protein